MEISTDLMSTRLKQLAVIEFSKILKSSLSNGLLEKKDNCIL
jgi:hypothetical protein